MKIIVITQDLKRYWWEMLVQINNFKKRGYDTNLTYLVATKGNKLSTQLIRIAQETGVEILGFKDRRYKHISYNQTIRPYLLKKYLYKNMFDNNEEPFLYLDTDVLFLRSLGSLTLTNDTWYVSNTKTYLNSDYIKSKNEDLFSEMCSIVGIDPAVVESNDENAGGAQYLIKNTDWQYWQKVEEDSERLYKHMINTSGIYKPEDPIQAWTADMWAVLWNSWLQGHQTKIVKTMDFLWATDPKEKYGNNPTIAMYHNAGVVDQPNLFYKGTYINRTPFNDDLSFVDKNYCSDFYVQEIMHTKNNYPELIKIL
jgi:hypothetical protein